MSLTTRNVQRSRILGTVLPVENVQLYRRMVANHKEGKKEEEEVEPALKKWEIAARAALGTYEAHGT